MQKYIYILALQIKNECFNFIMNLKSHEVLGFLNRVKTTREFISEGVFGKYSK